MLTCRCITVMDRIPSAYAKIDSQYMHMATGLLTVLLQYAEVLTIGCGSSLVADEVTIAFCV